MRVSKIDTMTLSSSLMSESLRMDSPDEDAFVLVISEPVNITLALSECSMTAISASEAGNLKSRDFKAIMRFDIQSLKLP